MRMALVTVFLMALVLTPLRDESSSSSPSHLSTHAAFLPHPPEEGISIAYNAESAPHGNQDPPVNDMEGDDYADPSPVPNPGTGGEAAPILH